MRAARRARARATNPHRDGPAPRRRRPLQCSWSELMAAIERAPDLDALIAAHSAYLTSIAEEGLFLEHAPFTDPIRAITETVFEFGRTQVRPARAARRGRDGREPRARGSPGGACPHPLRPNP